MRLLVDVDDVLASFLEVFVRTIVEMGIKVLPENERPHLYDLEVEFNITTATKREAFSRIDIANLPINLAALTAVLKIADEHEVFFVTAYEKTSTDWTFKRDQWLLKHFGALGRNVVHTKHKHLCRGDVLVDDKTKNVVNWTAENPQGYGVLWAKPYNNVKLGPNIVRTASWDVVSSLLEETPNDVWWSG